MRQRLVGINHVALEVDDVDEALEFYGKLFDFKLREREPGHVEIALGDQFIALEDKNAVEPERHFGLVVPDKEAVRQMLKKLSLEVISNRNLDFRDPYGNRIQVVQYDQIQFTKPERILRGMGLNLDKTRSAIAELKAQGLA